MAHHFAFHRTRVDPREMVFHAGFEQRKMRNIAKMFGDKPDISFRRHPIQVIKPGQVYRARISSERALAAQVEVDIEIAQRQFAQSAVDRLSIAAPGEIGFGDGAPMAARFEDRDDVIGVLIRFEIENERRETEHAQSRRREGGALEAMRCLSTEHNSRRPCSARQMIWDSIEIILDAGGCS